MKKLVLYIICCIGILIGISSCFEFEISLPTGDLGGYYSWDSIIYDPPVDTSYQPGFFIDSLRQSGKSEITFWAHIVYDTLLVINYLSTYVGYLDQPQGQGFATLQDQADTINFAQLTDTITMRNGRKEWIYKYEVKLDSLSTNVPYWFCVMTGYTEFSSGWPAIKHNDCCTDYYELK